MPPRGELRLAGRSSTLKGRGARPPPSGEAGIGKTTIWLTALQAAAERGYRVGRHAAEARLPLAGLNDLLADLVDAWGSRCRSRSGWAWTSH